MNKITLINPYSKQVLIEKADGLYDDNGLVFPCERGAYRIVQSESNYTDNFGFQWNKFRKTQIDRESRFSSISKDRFFAQTDWDKEDLEGKNVLEVGSGAGRFTQVLLDYTKANVYSLDYSDAVTANFQNNGQHKGRIHLYQASVYEMPFPDDSFDKVFCFGVLQHTPDFKKSVKALVDKLKPGGELAVDFYPINGWWTKIHAKYMYRPYTKKLPHEKLLRLIEENADRLINLSSLFDKAGVGRLVNRFLPVCDIKGTLPRNLPKEELKEWVVLDTFDMYSPEHDHPQKISTVKNWFEEFGMQVTFAGKIPYLHCVSSVVKGIKK